MIFFRSWYWTVGGDTARAYFSGTNTYVPTSSDADFITWKNAGNTPIPILNEAELWVSARSNGVVLPAWLFDGTTFVQPAVGEYTDTQLAAYAADARSRKVSGGIVVNGQPFFSDALTVGSVNSAYIYTQGNAGATFSWKLPDGSFVTLAKNDIAQLQTALASFGQACYACEDDTLTGIEAGTITTTEQIDAAFAAVSNSFTGLLLDEQELNRRHVPKTVVK